MKYPITVTVQLNTSGETRFNSEHKCAQIFGVVCVQWVIEWTWESPATCRDMTPPSTDQHVQ